MHAYRRSFDFGVLFVEKNLWAYFSDFQQIAVEERKKE
jgi:hypothetical protein